MQPDQSEYTITLRQYYEFRREFHGLCQAQLLVLQDFFKAKNSFLNSAGLLTDMTLITAWLQPDKTGKITFPISRSKLHLALRQSYQNHAKMTAPELPEEETVHIIMNALDSFIKTQLVNT